MAIRPTSGKTSNDIEHSHRYEVDGNGNGWALEAYNSQNPNMYHKHEIKNWIVESAKSGEIQGIVPHIHNLPLKNGAYAKGGKIKNPRFKGKKNIIAKHYSAGGMLVGPSHNQGGIPAIVDGVTPIEVEGGEFVVNKQTVQAVGENFLHKLNSTQTSYHTGGFNSGELSGSNYAKGGKISKKRGIKLSKLKKFNKGGGVDCSCKMFNNDFTSCTANGCKWDYSNETCS